LGPRLSTLISAPLEDDKIHVPGEAVQLANALLRSRGGPIEMELVQSVTGSVMRVLADTDDMDVIQVSCHIDSFHHRRKQLIM
jgi:hypothetical protein